MPEFEPLTPEELVRFRAFKKAQADLITFETQRLMAKAAIRLTDAVSPTLDPSVREQALLMANLTERKAKALRKLATLGGAIRFASDKVRRALSRLELGGA
jgi:hypothetical protein